MSDILAETPDRFLLLPVRDEQAWAFYQEAVACFLSLSKLSQSVSFLGNMLPRMHVYGKVSPIRFLLLRVQYSINLIRFDSIRFDLFSI